MTQFIPHRLVEEFSRIAVLYEGAPHHARADEEEVYTVYTSAQAIRYAVEDLARDMPDCSPITPDFVRALVWISTQREPIATALGRDLYPLRLHTVAVSPAVKAALALPVPAPAPAPAPTPVPTPVPATVTSAPATPAPAAPPAEDTDEVEARALFTVRPVAARGTGLLLDQVVAQIERTPGGKRRRLSSVDPHYDGADQEFAVRLVARVFGLVPERSTLGLCYPKLAAVKR